MYIHKETAEIFMDEYAIAGYENVYGFAWLNIG